MNPRLSRYYTYVRPILRSKFAKTYSTLIFSLVTIAVFSVYAIRPTVTTILSLLKSIDEQNQILNQLQEKVSNLSSGKRNYENINPSTKTKLENLIPDNPALAGLINTLTHAATTSEASVSGIQFQPMELESKTTQLKKNAEIKQIDFTFNAQGSYASLMKLLTTLKRTDRLVTITAVNFAKPPDANLIMSISGKAYYIDN